MNVTREIQRINAGEIDRNISTSASWHAQYKDSPYIFIGNIPFDLTEGDIITIFSQYGEVLDLQLVRNKQTGESKGFAFLRYEDQKSTILAVDNLNNFTLLGRTLRVDHTSAETKDGEKRTGMNAAPPLLGGDDESMSGSNTEDSEDFEDKVDPDDPMREYIIKKLKKEKMKAKKKAKKEKKKKKRDKNEEIDAEKEDVTRKRSRSRSRPSSEQDLEQNKSYIRNKARSSSRSSGHDVRRHEYDRDGRGKDVTRDRSRSRSRNRYDRSRGQEHNQKVDNKDFRGRNSQSDDVRSGNRRVTRRSQERYYYSEKSHKQRYGRSPSPSNDHVHYDRYGRYGRYDRYDRYDNDRNYRRNKRSRSRSIDGDRKKSIAVVCCIVQKYKITNAKKKDNANHFLNHRR
ncbi:hypothetical protein RCL_jg4419.t1 [Rhizophagus clarus]|uniref:RRM domain-containing protein n=1 Tax=Rhizophagus clarus TaxID=94130 RepID=A0A8H3KSI9_9GLOM|nr:hypothetical protein RCL_jg4419.t1 [Rhizophagus clarus]